jgi:hypothetical protein
LKINGCAIARVTVSERTGAPLLDPFPDICGTDDSCSSFFEGGEPKFSDGLHLRPQICTASHQISGFFLSSLRFAADLTDHGGDEFALTSEIVAVERRLGASFPGLNE